MNQSDEYFLHIFNVQQGDSLLLEFPGNKFGVIDCKYHESQNTDDDPPALAYLKTRNVDHLEFICLSHPHLDHYHGLWKICQYYSEKGRTFKYFIFPGISLKLIAESYDARSIRRNELTKLFECSQQLAINNFKQKKNLEYFRWFPFVPDFNVRPFFNMEGMDIIVFSPAEEAVAEARTKLEAGESINWNHISMAWLLSFFHKKVKILISGDTENYTWKRIFELFDNKKDGINLKCDLVKIAHHGSKSSFSKEFFKNITYEKSEAGESSAIISTGGTIHHPSETLLKELLKNNVNLYCTNKGPHCRSLNDHLPKIKVKHENRLENLLKTKKREKEKQIKAYRKIKEKLRLTAKRNECSGDMSIKITPLEKIETYYQERKVACFYKEQVMKSWSNNS